MKGPVDGNTLQMTERQGVEIDYRPECRGVWLDRGELDKIVERSAASEPPPRAEAPPRGPVDRHSSGSPPKHRKKSMLQDLFDF
ncbi:MAG: zf-TFIIB domain-containing protein [Azospirillaceae bacterium]